MDDATVCTNKQQTSVESSNMLIINDILYFITTAMHKLPRESIISSVLSFHDIEKIREAKEILYSYGKQRNIKRRGENSTLNEIEDILDFINNCSKDDFTMPTFLACNYVSLPPRSNFNSSIDILTSEIKSIKIQMESLKIMHLDINKMIGDGFMQINPSMFDMKATLNSFNKASDEISDAELFQRYIRLKYSYSNELMHDIISATIQDVKSNSNKVSESTLHKGPGTELNKISDIKLNEISDFDCNKIVNANLKKIDGVDSNEVLDTIATKVPKDDLNDVPDVDSNVEIVDDTNNIESSSDVHKQLFLNNPDDSLTEIGFEKFLDNFNFDDLDSASIHNFKKKSLDCTNNEELDNSSIPNKLYSNVS